MVFIVSGQISSRPGAPKRVMGMIASKYCIVLSFHYFCQKVRAQENGKSATDRLAPEGDPLVSLRCCASHVGLLSTDYWCALYFLRFLYGIFGFAWW